MVRKDPAENIERFLSSKDFCQNEDFDWDELTLVGFPFRLEKEKKTGVKKDQTSANPYVEISPLADPVAKKAERKKYAAWGKEAVEKIFAEKGAAGVKS